MARLQHVHVHGLGLHVSLFIGADGLFQHIGAYRQMVDPVGFGSGDRVSLPVELLVPAVIIGIAADPAGNRLPLPVLPVPVRQGLPRAVRQGLIEGHLRPRDLLLGPGIHFGKGIPGKCILQEELLLLFRLGEDDPQIFRLDIALAVRRFPLLQDVGPKGQAGNQMAFLRGLGCPGRACAFPARPALLLCHRLPVLVVDGQAVLIVHGLFVDINLLDCSVLVDPDGAHQLLPPRIVHGVGQNPSIIIIDIGHARHRVRMADGVPVFIQHGELPGVRVLPQGVVSNPPLV